MVKKTNTTSEDRYRMFLVENIRVGARMLYEMAYDIAGKTDRISDLSVTITFDQEMKSLPELTITRSHLPSREQVDYLFDLYSKTKTESMKEKGLTSERGIKDPYYCFDTINEPALREMTIDKIEKEVVYKVENINKEDKND